MTVGKLLSNATMCSKLKVIQIHNSTQKMYQVLSNGTKREKCAQHRQHSLLNTRCDWQARANSLHAFLSKERKKTFLFSLYSVMIHREWPNSLPQCPVCWPVVECNYGIIISLYRLCLQLLPWSCLKPCYALHCYC